MMKHAELPGPGQHAVAERDATARMASCEMVHRSTSINKPKLSEGKMDYEVLGSDTLERIAALHDCTVGELMKMNKMSSRMVFPGQKLLVPIPPSDDVFEAPTGIGQASRETISVSSNIAHSPQMQQQHTRLAKENSSDGIVKGPGCAVPVPTSTHHHVTRSSAALLSKAQSVPLPPTNTTSHRGALERTRTTTSSSHNEGESVDQADQDVLQRFLKIKVKQLTQADGTVTGTLLVTPNCLMFDPDVSHPLVKEKGSDLYGMVANMEDIMCVSLYKDIGVLTGDVKDKTKEMYDPQHVRTPEEEDKTMSTTVASDERAHGVLFKTGSTRTDSSDAMSDVDENDRLLAQQLPKSAGGSASNLPAIMEESGMHVEIPGNVGNDASNTIHAIETISNQSTHAIGSYTDRPRAHSDLQASSSLSSSPSGSTSSRYSPNTARRSVAQLGRTLSARASSLRGHVTSGAQSAVSGAQSVAQNAVSGTMSMAQEVVSHTKSAADSLQQGAKAAADAVASVPQNIVNMSSGLFTAEGFPQTGSVIDVCDSLFMTAEEAQRSPTSLKREQSLATLQSLRVKTQQAREQADAKQRANPLFSCATSCEDMPDLFRPMPEMLTTSGPVGDDIPPSPLTTELPYYLAVRLNRRKTKVTKHRQDKRLTGNTATCARPGSVSSEGDDCGFGNRLKREFWFAVPRSRADNIYHFLLHWSPEKYGNDPVNLDDSIGTNQSSMGSQFSGQLEEQGFIVLDSEVDDALAGEKPASPLFGDSTYLNREWEIVTVQEMCRRLSLSQLDTIELPIPDGATTSRILDQAMIRQILDILPPRAEGYPWSLIYNSEKHGFSLSTMYRKMAEWDEDMSPVLLIIRDINEHVFGAVVSAAIRPQEHFFGTGDSCFLWRFIGDSPHTRQLQQFSWTGENQLFVKASRDSVSIGASGGHYGLWLDADLNHGRSQRCATFDNEPLAGEKQDFIVQFVEAYGFRIS